MDPPRAEISLRNVVGRFTTCDTRRLTASPGIWSAPVPSPWVVFTVERR
jgi:hypothetical protein